MIYVRKVREDDLENIMVWRMSEGVTQYMFTNPELTLEKQKSWYEKVSNDDSCKYWVIVNDEIEIGIVAITDITESTCALAWYIGNDSYRGQGVGTKILLNLAEYVFEKLGLEELVSEVLAINKNAIGLYKKCGFFEEVDKSFVIKKNNIDYNVISMSLKRKKWLETSHDYEKIFFRGN